MILLLDKPPGVSSASCVRRIGGAARARTGHAGTLDPGATGLLVVCVGESRKLVALLTGHDKEYLATVKLGVGTTTLDRFGEVTGYGEVPPLDVRRVEECLEELTGRIRQVVPAFSAVKVKGRPLYRVARTGQTPVTPTREVVVHEMQILGLRGDEIDLRISCGAGTYVRAIARDLASSLGTVGHLGALRRTAVGAMRVEDAHGIDAILEAVDAGRTEELSWPASRALAGQLIFEADPGAGTRLSQGRAVDVQELRLVAPGREPALVLDRSGEPLCVAKVVDGRLCPSRVLLPSSPGS